MDLDFFKYSAIISAIVTFLIACFDKEHKRYNNYQESYYNYFLVKFYNLYREDRSVDPIFFYNHTYTNNDNYLPSYIKYLIDNKNKQLLIKVLIVDYLREYPSLENSFRKSITKILDRINYLAYWGCFAFLYIVLNLFGSVITSLITEYSNHGSGLVWNIPDYIIMPIPLVFMIGLIIYLFRLINLGIASMDDYTLITKKIEKILKSREKTYVKFLNKYYI